MQTPWEEVGWPAGTTVDIPSWKEGEKESWHWDSFFCHKTTGKKKGLSVKVGSHSNVPSAVSPRELMEKSVALPYLLKCLSSPPFLCSAFPISK